MQVSIYSPSGKAVSVDHSVVSAFAGKNIRHRFYIPKKDSYMGDIHYEHVLIDCGCSSTLLPFPGNGAALKAKYLAKQRFKWTIAWSKGTGIVHFPILKVMNRKNLPFPCILAVKEQSVLRFLRFHLGSNAIQSILNDPAMRGMLDDECVEEVDYHGEYCCPRTQACFARSAVLERICLLPIWSCRFDAPWTIRGNLRHYLGMYRTILKTKVDQYEGFHGLEDEDHDAASGDNDLGHAWSEDEDNGSLRDIETDETED